MTDCSGQRTTFRHDGLGRMLTRTDALGHVTHYEWDAAGRVTAMMEADGATHRYTWSAGGRLLVYTDPLGATTRYRYDSHGDPVERIDPNAHTLQYVYDAARRLVKLINENGEATRFEYDLADQLTDEIGFDGRYQRYCYNAAGELTHLIEIGGSDVGPGKVTHFERDALGRLTARLAEGDADCQSRFAYDALGRLTAANNPAAEIAFVYDPVGQLLSETQTLAGARPRGLRHRYDELGNRIETALPDGRVLHWLFYGSGHLHQINLEEPGRHGAHRIIADIERDVLHREVRRSQGALESQYDYDPAGRLAQHKVIRRTLEPGHTAAVGIGRNYRYDAAGNLIEKQDLLRGPQTYRYDPAGRILAATGRVEEFFAFDPAGNLLSSSSSGSGGKVRGNRVTTYQDLRYSYDVHGNVVTRDKGAHEHARLVWNADHRLQKAVLTRNGLTQITHYEYDALGRRTRKIDPFNSTEFLWDRNLMVNSIRGNKYSLFVFDSDSFVPLATVQNEAIYWYQCDQIGAPQELTNENGNIVWARDYKVWGQRNYAVQAPIYPSIKNNHHRHHRSSNHSDFKVNNLMKKPDFTIIDSDILIPTREDFSQKIPSD